MKKLLVILMAVLIPAISFAQRGIPRSNNVSVSVKRVTETTVEKDYKTYNARVGFQQVAGVNIGAYEFEEFGLGISYVGGYRFNDWLFTGIGFEYNCDIFDTDDFYVPIYGQIRTYFTKRIWRPYVALSAGYMARNREYWGYNSYDYYEYTEVHSSFYADFTFGVDVRLAQNMNLFMAAGVNNMGVFFKTGVSF